jgi:glucokinase
MYVTGGLTPKNIKFIEGQDSPFMKAYHDKGRVLPVLEHVPIFAVMVEDLGVRGALKCAVLVRVLYFEEKRKNEKEGNI